MNALGLWLVTLAVLGAPRPETPPGRQADLKPKVDALAQPLVDSRTVSGLAIGLIDGGKTYTFGYGRVSDASNRTPDGRTVFEIGSVTKVFTSLALADMVRDKMLALNDPVNRWLPETAKLPDREGHAITLLHLATHTSGLPRLPENLLPQVAAHPENPYAAYTVQQLYDVLPKCRLESTPGTRYSYSNFGAGLLGQVLGRRSGVSYEEVVLGRVCRPLGMNETRIALPRSLRARLAQGHDAAGRAVPPWDIPTLAGGGALRSTVADLLVFLDANLALRPNPLAEAIAMTHVPRHQTPQPHLAMALGWHFNPQEKVYWHNGQTGGYHSFVAFQNERKVGVVVLCNTASGTVDQLGNQLLRLLLGKPVEPLKLKPPAGA